MSEELTTLVQVLELYGRGLNTLGKAIKFTSKGVSTGVDIVKLKNMQRKMKLHYASTGNHKTMKLKDLEELTGGNYKILNIPLEDEGKLLNFYDSLKRMKVSFAELPDLCIGDGYTQIAYNPQDAEKVKAVVESHRKKLSEEPKEISLEDYEKLGGEEGKKILDELATKGYERERCVEQITRIHDRNKSKDYTPITLNFESILIEECKDRYYFRIPKSQRADKTANAICIKKEDVLIVDDGKTAFAHLKNDGKIAIFNVSAAGAIDKEHPQVVNTDSILKKFGKVDVKELWQVNHIKPTETDKLPNFNKGQEDIASALSTSSLEDILHFEEIKELKGRKDYMPLEIDVGRALVGEENGVYVIKLPSDGKENYHCLIIDKKDAYMSEDGKTLSAFLKKGEEAKVREIDKAGNVIRTYGMKNEKIASKMLRSEHKHIPKRKTKIKLPDLGVRR